MTKLMGQGKARVDFKIPGMRGGFQILSFHGFGRPFVSFDFVPLSFLAWGPGLIHISIQIAMDVKDKAGSQFRISLHLNMLETPMVAFEKIGGFDGKFPKGTADLIHGR